MALTPYEQAHLQMLSEEQQLIVLTAEQILDGENSPEITLLEIKYSEQIATYIRNKSLKLSRRGRAY